MSKKYLSRDKPSKPIPAHSHRNSYVWQFLDEAKPGAGELGELIRRLKTRRDMPDHCPHRTSLIRYLHQCKIDSAMIMRNATHLYNMYYQFYQHRKHPPDDTVIEFVDPAKSIKSGVSRDQLALAILEGFGSFERPAVTLAEGGKWADSAYGAADSVIFLLTSKIKEKSL